MKLSEAERGWKRGGAPLPVIARAVLILLLLLSLRAHTEYRTEQPEVLCGHQIDAAVAGVGEVVEDLLQVLVDACSQHHDLVLDPGLTGKVVREGAAEPLGFARGADRLLSRTRSRHLPCQPRKVTQME